MERYQPPIFRLARIPVGTSFIIFKQERYQGYSLVQWRAQSGCGCADRLTKHLGKEIIGLDGVTAPRRHRCAKVGLL